jgi:cytochrome c553
LTRVFFTRTGIHFARKRHEELHMHRTIIAIGVFTAALLVSAPAWTQQLPAIKSTTVDLPAGDDLFPGGASADAINQNCLACHSSDMVLNQPALPRATWEAEVHKMINTYKAPVDSDDVAPIVDYLVKIKGTN